MNTETIAFEIGPDEAKRKGLYSMDEIRLKILEECQNMIKKQQPGLLEKSKDASEAIDACMRIMTRNTEEFKRDSNAMMVELRAFRMSVVAETNIAISKFQDLRKFFFSNEHTEEVKRLEHFIDLCERLNALKNSGMLDAVADTILKLDQ